MINRQVTRVLKNSTEVTSSTNTINSDTVAWALTALDAVYIGFQNKFAARYFQMGTVNVVANTVSVSYWNGTAYTAVQDLLDQTVGFTQSGFISWTNQSDWQAHTQTGTDSNLLLYWVKLTTNQTLTAGATLQCVLNLFCDDSLVRAYYPEIITDTRYLPSSRTNFLEQYVAAKDLTVLRLKQRRLIDLESQIIDPNNVAIASVHAAAYLILSPIASSDSLRQMADQAKSEFEKEVSQLNLGIDQDKDGIVTDTEQTLWSQPFVVRR